MRITFVASNLIGSRLIRWGTSEDCSHVALVFDVFGCVFHSTGRGVKIELLMDFEKKYKEVHSIDVPLSPLDELSLVDFLKLFDGALTYDFAVIAYFAWRVALRKLFSVPYPKTNPLDNQDRFICTEAVYLLLEWWAAYKHETIIIDKSLSMLTPHQLYLELKEVFK